MSASGSPYEEDDYDEGETQGRYSTGSLYMLEELQPREKKGKSYAWTYLAEEEEEALKTADGFYGLDEIETVSSISGSYINDDCYGSYSTPTDDATIRNLRGIRQKYYEGKPKPLTNLMIHHFKEKILSAIEANQIVVLSGPTGCGKSTQVPQYILDSVMEKGQYCNIAATQPRKVAVTSISQMICRSREWPLGSLCGFKVGLKERTSNETMLTFMTTGILLQHLINKKTLCQFTHIILDEVHERDQSMDFLLIVIKKLLREYPSNTKIILMSATLNTAKFANYFPRTYQGELIPCPVVKITQESNFKIDIKYLDDLAALGSLPPMNIEDPTISEQNYDLCVKLIQQFEDFEENRKMKSSVLIFLPGLYEIEHLYYKLKDAEVESNGEHEYKWSPLPLHSSVTIEEQEEVFLPPIPGYRKIILSTNIAESSITVPGVKYVIDFCLMKRMKSDPNTNFSGLQLCWTSRSNCVQRAGRVGRLMDGYVFRMVYRRFYKQLNKESIPEMLDAPLDRVILQSKVLDMGEPKAILALALDPPDLSDIEWTVLTLKEAGGLLRHRQGVYTPDDGDLTFLGRLMAALPVETRLTKLMVMGHIFGCLGDCIIMGAAMHAKNIFNYPFRDRLKAYELKCNWAENSFSDCIALLNIYKIWERHRECNYFARSNEDNEMKWATRHFVHLRALKETKLLVEEITNRLKEYNIEELHGRHLFYNDFERVLLLKVAIAGAFYPYYYCSGYQFGNTCEVEAVKQLGEQNPLTTVVLHGFPSDQPMQLYFRLIENYLSDWNAEMKLHAFGCSKILVEFRQWESRKRLHGERNFDVMLSKKIPVEVYRALKTRLFKKSIDIKILPASVAMERAQRLGLTSWSDNSKKNRENSDNFVPCSLPAANVTIIEIVIGHIVDPGHFWAYFANNLSELGEIRPIIDNNFWKCEPFKNLPVPGEMCIAPVSGLGGVRFCRGRIESVKTGPPAFAKVLFVDHGNCQELNVNTLWKYGPEMANELKRFPAQAFECVLSGVRPSYAMSPKGLWTKQALSYFKNLIHGRRLYGKIYSVVHGVVAMELHNSAIMDDSSNVNLSLIERNYAERVEEPYLSRLIHLFRSNVARLYSSNINYEDAFCKELQEEKIWGTNTGTTINERELTVQVKLKGPTSPLEMTLYPCMRGTSGKTVVIAEDSVNSVLLNSEPSSRHDRLVVAGNTNQNADGFRLILNHTTVMPNIPGLPALINLIFAPEVEFRVSPDGTRYTGALCGLGADSNGRAFFPEHDMEVHFDTEITFADYLLVNSLRSLMSRLLRTNERQSYITLSETIQYQRIIKYFALKILTKKRSPIEVSNISEAHDWRRVLPDLLPRWSNSVDARSVFPPHSGIILRKSASD